jgi:integrase
MRFPSSPPRERYVLDEEFLAVRDLAPPMVAHAMNLALLCGMDRSTILSLERRHITDGGILFRRPKTDKHASSREQLILWSDELRAEVDAILREPPRLRAALICTPKGTPYTMDGFASAWGRTMRKAEAAGIGSFHFHDLRAKSASEAESDQAAADRLGHGDVKLTQRVYRRLPRKADPAALPTRIVDKSGK